MRRLFESIKIAFQSLVSNKLRAFLTMLGIIIGVGAVVAMMSIGTGAQESVIKSVQDIGSNLIIVTPGNRQEEQQGLERMLGDDRDKEALKVEDVKMIEKETKLIKGAAPAVLSSSIITYLNKNTRASVYASSEKAEYIYNFEIEKGQFYTVSDVQNSANVAVIGHTVINMIIAQSTSENNMDQASKEVERILRRAHNLRTDEKNDFTVQNQTQLLDIVGTITNIFTITISSIAGISLLVGGIGIMNIMLVSVTERTREVGIRKAVGATRRDILIQFLLEAIALTSLGGVIGIGRGLSAAAVIARLLNFSTVFSPGVIILAFLFSAGVGVVFGFFPARKAARLDPIEAL